MSVFTGIKFRLLPVLFLLLLLPTRSQCYTFKSFWPWRISYSPGLNLLRVSSVLQLLEPPPCAVLNHGKSTKQQVALNSAALERNGLGQAKQGVVRCAPPPTPPQSQHWLTKAFVYFVFQTHQKLKCGGLGAPRLNRRQGGGEEGGEGWEGISEV